MIKQVLATALGFIATFIANSILAMTVIGPLLNTHLGISRDPVKDGLNFPAILVGYFLLAIFMVWLSNQVQAKTWLAKGLKVGVATGVSVFVAGHLIVAGWSIANDVAMFLSGTIDSLATIAGALVITFILRDER